MADVLIFTPANIKHRSRESFLRSTSEAEFQCALSHGTFKERKNWIHKPKYQNRTLDRADPQGLEEWSKTHIGKYADDETLGTCKYGTFVTSRDLVHSRPQEVFSNIAKELDVKEPEAGHYMERLVPVLFGNK